MFRLFACVVAFVMVALLATDVEAQIRRRRTDGVNVRAARGANVVVNQSFGGGGGVAQSAAIGGGGVRGFRVRGNGGIAASQAVGGFGVRGFGHHSGGAAFFVPQQQIQFFPVPVQSFGVQTFAAPVCNQGFGIQSFGGFGGGVSASAAVGY